MTAAFFDPEGERHGGLPTWPWRMAPAGLLTFRQLAALGLRPGGQPYAGQILWNSRRGGRRRVRVAYLYDQGRALPKRPATPAQLAAVHRAVAARRVCPTCGSDAGYVIPRSLGECLDCAATATSRVAARWATEGDAA
jgi:hypothetical protein